MLLKALMASPVNPRLKTKAKVVQKKPGMTKARKGQKRKTKVKSKLVALEEDNKEAKEEQEEPVEENKQDKHEEGGHGDAIGKTERGWPRDKDALGDKGQGTILHPRGKADRGQVVDHCSVREDVPQPPQDH
jgi:hypothetical protein